MKSILINFVSLVLLVSCNKIETNDTLNKSDISLIQDLNLIDENERINFKRNQKLIDFDFIPEQVSSSIISSYQGCEVNGSRMKIMSYLGKHKMKVLLQSISEF